MEDFKLLLYPYITGSKVMELFNYNKILELCRIFKKASSYIKLLTNRRQNM